MNGKRTGVNRDDLLAFARRSMIDNPNAIIKRCVDAVMEFRAIAKRYGVSEYWQDVVERHFAEMTPDLLDGLQGYKPPSVPSHPPANVLPGVVVSRWTKNPCVNS